MLFYTRRHKQRGVRGIAFPPHSVVTTDNITSFNLYNARIDLPCTYRDWDQSLELGFAVGCLG